MSLKDYMEADQSTPYFDYEWMVKRFLGLSYDDLKENESYKNNRKEKSNDSENKAKDATDSVSSF